MNANSTDLNAFPSAHSKRRRNIFITLIAGLVLMCCSCAVAAAIIVFADPFNLHITDRLFGGTYDAAAEAMPEDTSIYVGIDLLGATPDELDRVIRPFADALEIGQKSWDEIIQELDRYTSEEMDLTITDDIKPWIGQYIGLGIIEIRVDDSKDPVSLIIAAESRDNNAADDFLRKLQDKIEEKNDETVGISEYQGVTIYALQPEYGTGIAFCRSGNLVLFSLDKDDLHTAIDAQKGKSLADNQQYRQLIEKMPDKRLATLFFTSQEVEDFFNQLQRQTGEVFNKINGESDGTQPEISQLNLDTWDAMIMSVSINGAGLRLDTITSYNMDNISTAQRELLESMGKTSKTIEMFPEDTLAFITSQRPDRAYDVGMEAMRGLNQETSDKIDESLQSVLDKTGIDLENDLFHHLDGEFALGIIPSSQGTLAQKTNLDLGFALLAESSDTGALANTMDNLASKLEEGGTNVERSSTGDLKLYEFSNIPGEKALFVGGIENKYLAVASSSQTIEDLFASKASLSKSSRYRDAISPLPDGVTPVMFIDVEGILGIINESNSGQLNQQEAFSEIEKIFKPIPYVVAGNSKIDDGFMHMVVVIHIK